MLALRVVVLLRLPRRHPLPVDEDVAALLAVHVDPRRRAVRPAVLIDGQDDVVTAVVRVHVDLDVPGIVARVVDVVDTARLVVGHDVAAVRMDAAGREGADREQERERLHGMADLRRCASSAGRGGP